MKKKNKTETYYQRVDMKTDIARRRNQQDRGNCQQMVQFQCVPKQKTTNSMLKGKKNLQI